MKKLLVGLLVLGSFSTFANEAYKLCTNTAKSYKHEASIESFISATYTKTGSLSGVIKNIADQNGVRSCVMVTYGLLSRKVDFYVSGTKSQVTDFKDDLVRFIQANL